MPLVKSLGSEKFSTLTCIRPETYACSRVNVNTYTVTTKAWFHITRSQFTQAFSALLQREYNCHCHELFSKVIFQTNFKELVVITVMLPHLTCILAKNVVLEHTTKTTANGQLAFTFCTCMRWDNSPDQQVAVVCIHYSKRETQKS